ncbi:MAG: trimethylamine methyltransferase family protein [Planctomycetes bacterium]|nr:trimethylamine methyltransferase family protein [Planctomycetota bacterium]
MHREASARPCLQARPGVVVHPVERLDRARVEMLHDASLRILQDPGILCFNEEAAAVFGDAGCSVERAARKGASVVRIPPEAVERAVESAPSTALLGARDPSNALLLDAEVPRVYFGTGSETNVFLETEVRRAAVPGGDDEGIATAVPLHREERGSVRRLADSARLCDALENVDFFIRNVNVQDEEIETANKDVNVFFASLLYMSKHVQAGLTDLAALDDVIRMGEIVAGGAERFREAPPISFIACLVKSPLQMVDDTTAKVISIARRGVPLVISSSPQGGSTAPIQEEGMVALINAEILAGITLAQIVNPGTPVLYGAVPVRARLDTLHDLYGAPEFVHYNTACAQLARRYRIPCYSTAGVGDSKVPGMQATVEKVFSHLAVAQAGAQYIHYAFGLLDRTGTFSPVQAVIDDANVSVVKDIIRPASFEAEDVEAALGDVRKVMASGTGLFARHIRKQIRRGIVSEPYRLEGSVDRDEVIEKACARVAEVRATSGNRLSDDLVETIRSRVQGLLPQDRFEL